MNEKKAGKTKAARQVDGEEAQVTQPDIATKQDLKNYLMNVRDKLVDRRAPPLYAASAMQYVFGLSGLYDLMDKGNKELAKDIWMKLKAAGMQLRNPPMFFGEDGPVETN